MTRTLKKLCYLVGRSSIYLGAIVAGVVASEANRIVVPLLILFAAAILGEYLCYIAGQKGTYTLGSKKDPKAPPS
jgi:membrane protein DedA with SNARE-associated domain